MNFSELYESHIKGIKGNGSQFVGLCPFHDDRQHSFSFNSESGLSYCHAGCGSFNAAQFAERIGINPQPYRNGTFQSSKTTPKSVPKKEKDGDVGEIRDKYLDESDRKRTFSYHKHLLTNFDELTKGLNWNKGVVSSTYTGFDKDTHRFTFLHSDKNGKALNIKYHKGEDGALPFSIKGHGMCRLYPLQLLEDYNRKLPLIFCEGEKDVLTLLSHGYQAVTSTTGAESIPKNLTPLKDFMIFIVFDNDKAGISGAKKLKERLMKQSPKSKVKVITWKNKPNKYDVSDFFAQEKDPADLLAEFDSILTEEKQETHQDGTPLPALTLAEVRKNPKPLPEMIIERGLLINGGVLMIAGAPKAGKSQLSLNLALCLSSGQNWFDFIIPKPVKTLLIQAEVLNPFYEQRLRTMSENADFSINENNLLITPRKQFDLLTDEGLATLTTTVQIHKPEVTIIDPLVMYHAIDENDNSGMAKVIGAIRNLTDSTSFIIIHHARKETSDSPIANMRGASSIAGAVDGVLEIQKGKKVDRIVKFDLRYDAVPDELYLAFNSMTLWFERTIPELTENQEKMLSCLKFGSDYTRSEIVNLAKEKGMPHTSTYKTFNSLNFYLNKNGELYSLKKELNP